MLQRGLMALMLRAANISETSANIYQNKWRNIPEDSHLHTCRHEKQKSHTNDKVVSFHALRVTF
jgi:hypothetical protein